ncbi:MAG: MerR family DNA-binding protein [Burkholderiales bacterium]|nr:MerR family DNA-binding protein [Burkholderiales bacterium]
MLTVIELSRHSNVRPHVVRYYSRIGLLSPARNPDNGYKLFAYSDVPRLIFIRQAQRLGYTLEEIREILDESSQGKSPCHRVREILQQRIEENRQKLDELIQLQNRMEDALQQWGEMPDGMPDGTSVCHLIESAAGIRYNA